MTPRYRAVLPPDVAEMADGPLLDIDPDRVLAWMEGAEDAELDVLAADGVVLVADHAVLADDHPPVPMTVGVAPPTGDADVRIVLRAK